MRSAIYGSLLFVLALV